MEIRQLRYFKHVAEAGSFSRAATILSVAQPALSRQIRKLEEELDVQSLYRNGRGVTTTETGAVLLERAKGILEQCAQTVGEITSVGDAVSGRVTLGLTPTVSQVLIRPLIAKLKEDFPLISLEVVEGFSGHVGEWLDAGRLDIGLLNIWPRSTHLAAEKLFVEELFLVGPPDKKKSKIRTVSIELVETTPLILPSHPHGLRELVDQVSRKHGFSPVVAYEINALSIIKDLVEDGTGWTMLPYTAVLDEVNQGRLKAFRIKDQPFSQTVVLETATHRPLSRAGHKVLECVKFEVTELHAKGKWLGSHAVA